MDTRKKRSVAVTGGGSGLGRDIALGLAAKNYRVFGTAMTHEEVADRVVRERSDAEQDALRLQLVGLR